MNAVRAFIVGIARYGERWDADSASRNAAAVALSLRTHGVPADRIHLFLDMPALSPAEQQALADHGLNPNAPTHPAIETFWRSELPRLADAGDRLLTYWSGHGAARGQDRIFFCGDYTVTVPTRVFSANEFLSHLRSDTFAKFERQLMFADVCGTYSRLDLVPTNSHPSVEREVDQLTVYASTDGAYANTKDYGAFTSVLLELLPSILQTSSSSDELLLSLASRFEELAQKPFWIQWRGPTRQVSERRLGVRKGQEITMQSALPAIFARYVELKTRGFVGRAHLFAELEHFLVNNDCGYLSLVGEPGIGKSALLSEFVRRRSCSSYFFIRTDGITKAADLYDSLEDQITERFELDIASDPDLLPGARLNNLFEEAAKARGSEKVIVTIDALDECEDIDGALQLSNSLFLPRALPAGVYVILTRRPLLPEIFNVRLETELGVANHVVDLMTYETQNQEDIETFLRVHYEQSPRGPWLTFHKLDVATAVAELAKRSDSNFMYLRHILPHLDEHPADFAPVALPQGLKGYYEGHWQRMLKGHDATDNLFAAIYIIAAAQKPVSGLLLAEMIDSNPVEALRFIARWREFLEETGSAEPGYRLYHASFSDFLLKKDEIRWRTANRSLKRWLVRLLSGGQAS